LKEVQSESNSQDVVFYTSNNEYFENLHKLLGKYGWNVIGDMLDRPKNSPPIPVIVY
jgi:hypothetical protein